MNMPLPPDGPPRCKAVALDASRRCGSTVLTMGAVAAPSGLIRSLGAPQAHLSRAVRVLLEFSAGGFTNRVTRAVVQPLTERAPVIQIICAEFRKWRAVVQASGATAE